MQAKTTPLTLREVESRVDGFSGVSDINHIDYCVKGRARHGHCFWASALFDRLDRDSNFTVFKIHPDRFAISHGKDVPDFVRMHLFNSVHFTVLF
jgi:hypothetical protein